MIATKQLTERLLISGQPQLPDLEGLAAAGIKKVICNRPDNEEVGQPTMDEMEPVLSKQGIELIRYPVNTESFPGPDTAALGRHFDSGAGNVLAFCRTGTRSANLWVVTRGPDEQTAALDRVRSAGLEVSLAERALS